MVRPVQPGPRLAQAVIVRGQRTPFAKHGTAYAQLSALDLATMAVRELVERTDLDPAEVDAVVFGQVMPSFTTQNIAREIVLASALARTTDAYSVSRGCATSIQAIADAAMLIQTGQAQVVIAGGADSASDTPLTISRPLAEALSLAARAKTTIEEIKSFAPLSPKDLLPVPPDLRERSTQLTMGESAEKMAKENRIAREAQDAFAQASHQRAARAWDDGVFDDEVMKAFVPPSYTAFERDNLVQRESARQDYACLPPAFDPRHGTVTAGNSSVMADGAAAVLVMRSDVAHALGYKPLATIRAWAFAALDPFDQLLLGPAYATVRVLDAIGARLRDFEVVDMHEAFAAQVLSNLQAFASKRFAESLGRTEPIGEVDENRFNVHGGSIAIGHPFAATGARQVTTVAQELARRGGGLGLVTQCAAGGLGAAIVLEGS